MENFSRMDEVNAFWQGVKGEVRGIKQRGYVLNEKGWLHRGGSALELGGML